MRGQLAYAVYIALGVGTVAEVVRVALRYVERRVREALDVRAEVYLSLSDVPVVLHSRGTSGLTARIYKKLHVLLAREALQYVELVVEVVVRDNYVVVLAELRDERFLGVEALAGRARQLVFRIVPAYVVLEQLRRNDDLVHAVVRESKHHIAALVAEVLLLEHQVREREAQRYPAVVELLYHELYVALVGIASLRPAAVPQTRREYAVYRGYLHALAEVFGVLLHHVRKEQVELEAARKIGKMKSCFHCSSPV